MKDVHQKKMKLEEMVTDRQLFSEKVKQNAAPDLAAMGLEIVAFNVQNFDDRSSFSVIATPPYGFDRRCIAHPAWYSSRLRFCSVSSVARAGESM